MPAPNTVLLIAVLASFSTPFTLSAVNIALPAMAAELSLDALALGWVSLSFLLASAALLVPMGRAADIWGRKRIFAAGFVLFTFASLLCGLAGAAWQLMAARALQGAGSSMIFGTSVAMLTAVYPPEKRGKALGWVSAAVYTGLSLGPPLGGLLSEHLSWRAIFLVNVPLGLLVLWLLRRGLAGAEWRGAEGEPFDWAGAALYSASLSLVMYGLSRVREPAGLAILAAGVAGLAFFLGREAAAPHPLLNAGLFLRNRVLAYSNLAAFLNYAASFSASFLLSLHLQYSAGLGPREAGLLLVCQPVFMVLFSPWAGRLSDKVDPGVIASLGMAVTAASLLVFLGPAGLGPLRAALGLCALGFGLALFAAPNTNAVMGSVGKAHLGLASAALATMRVTGQVFSMAVVTLLFALFIGKAPLGQATLGGFHRAFGAGVLVFSGLAALGVLASLQRRRTTAP